MKIAIWSTLAQIATGRYYLISINYYSLVYVLFCQKINIFQYLHSSLKPHPISSRSASEFRIGWVNLNKQKVYDEWRTSRENCINGLSSRTFQQLVISGDIELQGPWLALVPAGATVLRDPLLPLLPMLHRLLLAPKVRSYYRDFSFKYWRR